MKSSANAISVSSNPVRLVAIAHAALRKVIKPGDTVVDATVGNGYDTLALAEWVGAKGAVMGFDIQPQAIVRTQAKLEQAKREKQVVLHCLCHSRMASCLPPASIAAAVFNLGFLPGSDHATITQVTTTIAAMDCAWGLLKKGGLLSVIAYPGHAGGGAECVAVRQWMHDKSAAGGLLQTLVADPAKADSPIWYCLASAAA
jgi:predicted methyltransferase